MIKLLISASSPNLMKTFFENLKDVMVEQGATIETEYDSLEGEYIYVDLGDDVGDMAISLTDDNVILFERRRGLESDYEELTDVREIIRYVQQRAGMNVTLDELYGIDPNQLTFDDVVQ